MFILFYKQIFLIIIIIYIIMFFILSFLLKRKIQKYSLQITKNNISANEIILQIIDEIKLNNISIKELNKTLADYYDVNNKTIYLSECNNSISSNTIALHELGHAIQDFENYKLLKIKFKILPFINILSIFGVLLSLLGILTSNLVLNIGMLLILFTFLFQLLTTIIEFDASKKIYNYVKEKSFFTNEELTIIKNILNLSAFSYIFSMFNNLFNFYLILYNKSNKTA